MPYIIFNKETLYAPNYGKQYDTQAGATRGKNAYLKRNPEKADVMVTATVEEYQKLDHDIVVFNCLTNKPVTIRKSEKGTCCDPSTERYHTM